MIKRLIFGVILLGGFALIGWGLWSWNTPSEPEPLAQPVPATTTSTAVEASTTSTVLAEVKPSTTTTRPPPPEGDAPIECALPVEIRIHFSAADSILSAPVDVSDTRFNPAKNRVDLHVSDTNGLPCAEADLPVKLLGHKQHQFCYLVLESPSFDPCEYGVNLGDLVEIVLADGEIVTYEVIEALPSQVASPLSEVYPEIGSPSPAVMFRKFTQYQQFYDEIFLREDASDELWLFTSCGNDIQGGHSQDACAVRTEFRHYTGLDSSNPSEEG